MELFGVRVDRVTLEEVVNMVEVVVREPRRLPLFIVTPNPEQIVQAQKDSEFRQILNSADLAIPDGWGLVVASLILNSNFQFSIFKQNQSTKSKIQNKGIITERVSGVEVMERLIKIASEKGWRVMLVGGKGETAERAAGKLRSKRSDLFGPGDVDKVGPYWINGVRGITDIRNPDQEEERELLKSINGLEPDLLFVGYGAPWQEKWAAKNRSRLKTKCMMVVGGAIDQIADPTLKPPKWLDGIGLGWLYRLVRQPWRWKRQLKLLRFGGMVMRERFKN